MRLIQRFIVVLIGMVFFFSGLLVSAQTQEKDTKKETKTSQEKPVKVKQPAKPITVGEQITVDQNKLNKNSVKHGKRYWSKRFTTRLRRAQARRYRHRQRLLRQREANLKIEKEKLLIGEKTVKGREDAAVLLESKLNTKSGELDTRANNLGAKEKEINDKVAAAAAEDNSGRNVIIGLVFLVGLGIAFTAGRKTAPKKSDSDSIFRYQSPPEQEEVVELEEVDFPSNGKKYSIHDQTELKS